MCTHTNTHTHGHLHINMYTPIHTKAGLMTMPKNQYEIVVQALKEINLRSHLKSTVYKLYNIEQTPFHPQSRSIYHPEGGNSINV